MEENSGCDFFPDHETNEHFNLLQNRIVNRLNANEELRNYISSKLEQSHVLNKPEAETMSFTELFDAILDEIKNPVLEKISEATWEILDSDDELGREINEIFQLQTDDEVQPGLSANDSHKLSDSEPEEPPGFSLSAGQKFAEQKIGSVFQSSDLQFTDEESVQKHDGRPESSMGLSHFGGYQFADKKSLGLQASRLHSCQNG